MIAGFFQGVFVAAVCMGIYMGILYFIKWLLIEGGPNEY